MPERTTIKRWTLDIDMVPCVVECEDKGYPHLDDHGDVQYDNTHFDNESEAWDRGRREVEAHVRLDGRDVFEAETGLERARKNAGESAKRFEIFTTAERQWKRRGPTNLSQPDPDDAEEPE